jgi:hypothetical protein
MRWEEEQRRKRMVSSSVFPGLSSSASSSVGGGEEVDHHSPNNNFKHIKAVRTFLGSKSKKKIFFIHFLTYGFFAPIEPKSFFSHDDSVNDILCFLNSFFLFCYSYHKCL